MSTKNIIDVIRDIVETGKTQFHEFEDTSELELTPELAQDILTCYEDLDEMDQYRFIEHCGWSADELLNKINEVTQQYGHYNDEYTDENDREY